MMNVLSHDIRITSLIPFPKAYLCYDPNVPGECGMIVFLLKGREMWSGSGEVSKQLLASKKERFRTQSLFLVEYFYLAL